MSNPIYKTRKGSIISAGSASAGAIAIAKDNGKLDGTWLEGFGSKRIELGSDVVLASNTKQATLTVYFDEEYPSPPKVYVQLRTATWNAKNCAGTFLVDSITNNWFTVIAIVNTDSVDADWNISNSIYFDWFSFGEFSS